MSCLLHERDLRLQMITQARLKDDARLPSSDDYVFLIRLSAICLYTVVTGRRAVWCLQTATSSVYLPGCETNEANLTAIETRRNSIFVACWQVTVPGKSQKLHYYPAVTRLSASVMRADVLSCGDRVVTAKFRSMETGRCITLGETPRRRRHTPHRSNNA